MKICVIFNCLALRPNLLSEHFKAWICSIIWCKHAWYDSIIGFVWLVASGFSKKKRRDRTDHTNHTSCLNRMFAAYISIKSLKRTFQMLQVRNQRLKPLRNNWIRIIKRFILHFLSISETRGPVGLWRSPEHNSFCHFRTQA